MFRNIIDYDKIAKDVNKYIKDNCSEDFIKKPNHKNEIFYNVQKYYFLHRDVVVKVISRKFCLYNYEYDIITKKVMNNIVKF